MQMAEVAAAIANGGRLMKPRLTDRIVRKDGRVKERIQPDLQSEVMKPETAKQLTEMMSRVVEEGTGTAAALTGVRVAGKTGTAEVGANREFTQPWFICFAPVDDPQAGGGGHARAPAGRVAGRHRGGADRQERARVDARGRGVTEVADNTLVDSRYLIVRRIGSGGMADVYCAEDTHLGRQVALKVLHRRFAQDQEFVERFRREASAAAGLQHPNVVGVFDRGKHDGTYYIAMEHLPGRTLKEIVTAEAPLPQEQVVDLGTQILQAAGFAHRHGVIHRDFKPHNVIVDDARRRQGDGLRHRAGGGVGDDRDRVDHGHRPVPVARAGAGPRGHRRVGPLLDRRDALRDARRAAAVRGRQRGLDRAQAPVGAAGRRSRSCART